MLRIVRAPLPILTLSISIWTSSGLLAGCGTASHRDPDGGTATDEKKPKRDASEPRADAGGGRRDGSAPNADAGPNPDGSLGDAAPELWARVGVPDAETQLYFQPLEEDGPISIRMGGQGGTHALIAIQCAGFGNRVTHQVSMRDLDGDGEVATLPLPRPRPVSCDEAGVCKISPIYVLLGGLAEPENWDGLHVEVTATVNNADGLEASHTTTGYLTRD